MTKIDDAAGCFLVVVVACCWLGSNPAVAAEAEKSKSVVETQKASVLTAPAGSKASPPVTANKAQPAKTTPTPNTSGLFYSGAKASGDTDKVVNTNPLPKTEVNNSPAPEKPKAKTVTQDQSAKPADDKGKAAALTKPATPDKGKTAGLPNPATPDKGKAAVPGKSKELAKNAKAVEPKKTAHHSSGGMLVPPPPPDTPTILAVPGGLFQSFPSTETSPANLAARKKELVAQLASAEKLLNVKTQHSTDSQNRAEQFKSLFSEGVISKRELDNAQTEAESSVTEVNDAKLKVTSLQNMIARVDERLAPKPTVKAIKAAKAQKSKKIAQTSKPKKNTSAGTDEKKGGG